MTIMLASTSYDRQTPWDATGTKIEANDLDGILKQAGLDFEVALATPVVNGTEADEFRAVHRTDTGKVFGIPRKGYQIVQNREAFGLVEDILGEVDVESAGTRKGGAVVWMQARVNGQLDIGGDPHQAYLTISTSHDGSAGVKAHLGFLRLFCLNQLPALRRGAVATWSHRHSRNVLAKADDARRILLGAKEETDAFAEEVIRLMETDVTDRRFAQIVSTVLPMSDLQTPRQRDNVEVQREMVRAMYASERDGGAYTGTGWGVVNAFNSFNQWAKPVKSTSERADRQIARTLDGTFGAMTLRVAEMVLA